ncbi:SDR family NAD(P)-dependent oxidoreductase [Cupriavidus numazuensis]|uniref:3-phenylpropionate-dihydrodiol/cinnamic acid-dihydrodiol dehydrogenase n=1 Tax=Cupriavidus numazuensis TaxID=221992 RepID=A0ABM8TKQ3_9BURK|nr:SDR family NAD(P)-dependent oxidoreductase [Cupriavidus numazuensis]CAG2151900.1 3-phenylpropionate-dihydrodiol/cinnamic acid-dihydrodiol dehydrogenase [Cupriavidus numazuensis]
MSATMQDKVVLITGAGGGIGRGIALAMAAAGARVVVNDLGVSMSGDGADTGPAQRVAEEIRAAGGQAVANTDSVSTWNGAHNIVQCAIDNFGRIDAVVNNAGNLRDRMFFKMNEEEWRSVIDVHLHGTFFVSRAAANYFKDQEGGAYVHMTSTSGLIGNLGQANYSAAKLGIVALSKSIALDMQRFNVRSNCIAPFAWSRMTSSIPAETPEEKARVAKLQKMEAGKIAPMAVFLASEAAREVSGQIFAVRANEIMLMSHSRPVRSVHMSEGWTPEAIGDVAIPAMRNSFFKLERSPDVIGWDPI